MRSFMGSMGPGQRLRNRPSEDAIKSGRCETLLSRKLQTRQSNQRGPFLAPDRIFLLPQLPGLDSQLFLMRQREFHTRGDRLGVVLDKDRAASEVPAQCGGV